MALDIWYNFLYRKIDSEYAFDDSIRNNPMSRFFVRTCETPIDGIDQNAKIVSYYGDLFILNGYDDTTKEKGLANEFNGSKTLTWMRDRDFQNHDLIWD